LTPPSQNRQRKGSLSGLRILVGRARHQASALSSELQVLGADIIEIPFIEIRKPRTYKPLDNALQNIRDYDWLILTSVNGVDALSARLERLKIAPTTLSDLQIAAIGPATAEEIKRLGVKVAVVPDRYVAESVVDSLRGKVRGKRVLLARAKVARDVIPRELRKMGAKVDVVEAYNTITPASSKKQLQSVMRDPKHRPHIVCFTSSSTVRNFAALLNSGHRDPSAHRKLGSDAPIPQFLAGIQFASIGPITSATLRELGFPVNIEATEYTIPGLIQAISASTMK